MEKIKIVLVDDQALFLESLKMVLETRTEDIEVIGSASNGEEAIARVKELNPHIVLMDVRMPVMDGVEATRIIHREFPSVQIMMLTTFDNDEYVYEALHDGAIGYLLKDIPPEELISSIRAMRKGAVQLSPVVAAKLIEKAYGPKKTPNVSDEDAHTIRLIESLSKREKEILKLIAKGHDNKEIAKTMFIAEQTVKNHVSTIYSKLEARDRIQAMQIAIKANLDG